MSNGFQILMGYVYSQCEESGVILVCYLDLNSDRVFFLALNVRGHKFECCLNDIFFINNLQ